jgi:hypothetical protein
MTIDLNREVPDPDLHALLKAAEANAQTDFEIEFCTSLREKFHVYGNRVMLTASQQHKLRCIALAGGFWERGECSI